MIITREEARRILKEHGFEFNTDTLVKNGKLIPSTSFNNHLGIKDNYKLKDVKRWLGY